mgnify:CR=1 FL=1
MKDLVSKLKQILDIEQNIADEDYLKVFVKNIAKVLDVKYVLIGHSLENEYNIIQTDIAWANNDFVKNFTYNLKDTPCEIVLTGKRVCIHEKNVCMEFPNDYLLKDMGVESYIGAPVINNNIELSSILVLLDTKPIEDKDFFISIVDLLSIRASAQLDKIHIVHKLKKEVDLRTLELEDAYYEIELINKNLAQRVEEEISKNDEKNRIIFEQSKMASISEMINNIIHQWRQSLSIISMHASRLQIEHELKSEIILTTAEPILSQINKLSNIIEVFSSFVKREKYLTVFYLNESIEAAINLTKSSIDNSFIKVVQTLNYNPKITTDKNELIEVFINIVNNSIDALLENIEDQKNRFIFIESNIDNKAVEIIFKDSAGGISDEILSKIFEPYFTTKHQSLGTGLGLSLANDIICNKYKGKIFVSNKNFTYNNKTYTGALFTIKLPLNINA